MFDKEYMQYLFSRINRIKFDSASKDNNSLGIIQLIFPNNEIASSALYYCLYRLKNKPISLTIRIKEIIELELIFEVKGEKIIFGTTVKRFDNESLDSFFNNVKYDEKNVHILFMYYTTDGITEEIVRINSDKYLITKQASSILANLYSYEP